MFTRKLHFPWKTIYELHFFFFFFWVVRYHIRRHIETWEKTCSGLDSFSTDIFQEQSKLEFFFREISNTNFCFERKYPVYFISIASYYQFWKTCTSVNLNRYISLESWYTIKKCDHSRKWRFSKLIISEKYFQKKKNILIFSGKYYFRKYKVLYLTFFSLIVLHI